MFLHRIGIYFVLDKRQRSDNPDPGFCRFDDIVDIAALSGHIGVGNRVVVLFCLFIEILFWVFFRSCTVNRRTSLANGVKK